MSNDNQTPTIEQLLSHFGRDLLAAAERQTSKGRPLDNLNLESIVEKFQGEQADLISKVVGPNLDDLYVVSGRCHGGDEDCVWIIESKDGDQSPDARAIQELGGTGDGDEDEAAGNIFYTTTTQLRPEIEERLIALPLED